MCVCVYTIILCHTTHQQHEVVKPLASLIELHRANPGSLEGLVIGRQ